MINKKQITTILALLLLVSIIYTLSGQAPDFKAPERGFTSWLPATSWENALLAGNGTMGAMVFGYPHDETIILNHAELYMPSTEPMKPINQASRLDEIRKLLFEGKYQEAADIPVEIGMQEGYGGTRWTDPYIPAFNVYINMYPTDIKKYLRMVDFSSGETSVCWQDERGAFRRSLFVSRADSIVVINIKGTGKITGSLEFARFPILWNQWQYISERISEATATASDNWLTFRSGFVKKWEGSLEGYEGAGRVIARGGTTAIKENKIVVTDADEVTVLIKILPSYNYSISQLDDIKNQLESVEADYDRLLQRHVAIHGELFNRVKLELGDTEDRHVNSETMILKACNYNIVSPYMIETLFDAARYNILCATGTNPPNLQGIWSASYQPPWSSDYTQNGNLPVAISSLLCGNMPELMMAYFNYQDRMLPYYHDNTKYLYGCRGIHVPSRTSSHGWDVHFGDIWCMTFWTAGAGWAANFYYDYYLYTGDTVFLKERAYPFMKEAAIFYEDFLITGDDGKYIFIPSYSPENNPGNSESQACINATMDVMVAKQLLRNCIKAGGVLGESSEKTKKWEAMLAKMPDYQVNEEGVLREWLWPGLEENYEHRHVSHLYGLFDIIDPDIAGNPVLINGCKKAIEEKMKVRRRDNGGIMVFGMVDLALAAANLGERKMVSDIIYWLSSRYWSNSLATYHDPGGLFNMDLSGGYPSVIIRTLAYSEPGLIALMPALPQEWTKGKIEGILLRGQIELKSLQWNGNKITAILNSAVKQEVTLKLPRDISSISGSDKAEIERDPEKASECSLLLQANEDIEINIELYK
jgi:alpha-L-fucosidase 2